MYTHYIDFLKSVNADARGHSGRTLSAHLEGTYALLQSWECEEQVCIAGLFHSIYGTNAFKSQCVSFDERGNIRDLIGHGAEHLSYLFCVIDRPAALLDIAKNGSARHRISGEIIPVNREEISGLLEIECANLIEQDSGRKFLASLLADSGIARACLKPVIVNAVSQYLNITPDKDVSGVSMRRMPPSPVFKQPNPKKTYPMKLRLCREDDIDQIVWLARGLHVDSRYASIPYKADIVKKRLTESLIDPKRCCLLACRNDEIVGFLMGSLDELFFSRAEVAVCRFLYVVRGERGVVAHRLLRGFILWAKKMEARECRLDDTFGEDIDRSEQLFDHLGMKKIGGIHSLWL